MTTASEYDENQNARAKLVDKVLGMLGIAATAVLGFIWPMPPAAGLEAFVSRGTINATRSTSVTWKPAAGRSSTCCPVASGR